LDNSGKSKVLIPRNLFELEQEAGIQVNNEGLSPVEISWDKGVVLKIKSIKNENNLINKILFPRFVESHAHFDKSFSWINYPNLQSNYENALSVNLEEHVTRTANTVLKRAEKSLNMAIKNGYRAIRTHIDTYNFQDQEIWPKLFHLQKIYSEFLSLQFVSLAQIDFWGTSEGDLFAKKLKLNNGILGGVLVPPFDRPRIIKSLSKMLLLAEKYKLEIDLHIDESSVEPGSGMKILLNIIEKLNSNVNVTCSHSSSLLLLKDSDLTKLANRMSNKNIKVIASSPDISDKLNKKLINF